MSNSVEILRSLQRKGVQLWLDDGRLRFRSPKGTLTAGDLDALRAVSRDLIDALGQTNQLPAVTPSRCAVQTADGVPLAVQQQWRWRKIERTGATCMNVFCMRMHGSVDAEYLRLSFECIVNRHDSLRARFRRCNGEPRQQFAPPIRYDLPSCDLSSLAEAERSAAVERVIDELSHQVCDLSLSPAFDARLLRMADHEHLVVWSMHHIIYDGHASLLLSRELWGTYRALAQGVAVPAYAPAPQYADYVQWQRELPESVSNQNAAYWTARLAGATRIRWPQDLHVPPVCGLEVSYERVPIPVDREQTRRLRAIAADGGTTLTMVWLTAYIVAISRWCAQTDLVVAIAVSGRDRPELEQMAGYCAYPLYLRIQLDKPRTARALVSTVTQEFYRALSHRDFGRTVEQLPNLHSRALFQWMPWNFDEPIAKLAEVGLRAEHVPIQVRLHRPGPFAEYDVMPTFSELSDELDSCIYCRTPVPAAMREFAHDIQSIAAEFAQES